LKDCSVKVYYYAIERWYFVDMDLKLQKLIRKEAEYKSTNLGLNLLISRLQRRYSINPSQAELDDCLQEIKAFIEKYASIMKNDIEAIKNL
jgi:hypothetical protein